MLIAPPIDVYKYKGKTIELAMNGQVHKINAGLALQLAKTWLDLQTGKIGKTGMLLLVLLNLNYIRKLNFNYSLSK